MVTTIYLIGEKDQEEPHFPEERHEKATEVARREEKGDSRLTPAAA